jgi:GNAT superfamily N-acetyltransferase
VRVTIRPPRPPEWRACRMLLPQSFGPVAPEAFVAWDESAQAIAGMAAFHRKGRETVQASVITVRPYRRQGIGSALLRRMVERAAERGDDSVQAQVDLIAHTEAHAFLTANGFRRGRILREVLGDLTVGRGPLLDMYARLATSGIIPASARVAGNREFSPREMEHIYTELLVPVLGTPAELAGPIVRGTDFNAIVLMAGDAPAGIMVCTYNDGGGTGTIVATAVAPRFRGWGWAHLLLLVSAMDRGWEAGARRLRFETDENNLNMMRQAERLNSVTLRRRAQYVLHLGAAGVADTASSDQAPTKATSEITSAQSSARRDLS